MNTNLLNALKQIAAGYGAETLGDARRVKALLADLAVNEPRPQKNALVACLEQGFAALLQNVPVNERGGAKAKLAERLNREEGLDPALCADTLDLLEAALFGTISAAENSVPERPAPMPVQPVKSAPVTYTLSVNMRELPGSFSMEQLLDMARNGQITQGYWFLSSDSTEWKPVTGLIDAQLLRPEPVTQPEPDRLSVPENPAAVPEKRKKPGFWGILLVLFLWFPAIVIMGPLLGILPGVLLGVDVVMTVGAIVGTIVGLIVGVRFLISVFKGKR